MPKAKEQNYPSNFIEVGIPSGTDINGVSLICAASIGSAIFVKKSDRSVSAVMFDFVISGNSVLIKLEILDKYLEENINSDEIDDEYIIVNPIDCKFEMG